jgi:hypothetical protein
MRATRLMSMFLASNTTDEALGRNEALTLTQQHAVHALGCPIEIHFEVGMNHVD